MASKNKKFEQKRAYSTSLDFQSNDDKIGDAVLIIIGFIIFYYISYLLEGPLHTFLSSKITLRPEYTVIEQLSKFYLFIVLLISAFSYRVLNQPTKIKLSISFFLFSLIMY